MSRPTRIISALALGLLVLSFPTCRWGEHTVRQEMTKFPAEFVAAHQFDWIFIRWVLPGIAMFFLGGILALVAIVSWIVEREQREKKGSPKITRFCCWEMLFLSSRA